MLKKKLIEDIMTKGVFTVTLEDPVHKADDIMKRESIRHIPVVDNGKFVGLITERSLVEYSLKKLYDYEEPDENSLDSISDFREIMDKNVRVAYPEDSVLKAVELMAKKKVDCLPIVDWKNHLVGILTSTDIFLYIHNLLKEEYSLKA